MYVYLIDFKLTQKWPNLSEHERLMSLILCELRVYGENKETL